MKENKDPETYTKLPRYDLREEAFRKYEPYMVKAALALSLVVEVYEFPSSATQKMKKAQSFICRFNDAKVGYKRYNYKSAIPPMFNVDNLRATEIHTGGVVIENRMYTAKGAPVLSSDHEGLITLAQRIKNREVLCTHRIPIRMVDESLAADLAFIESLQAEDSPYYGAFTTTPTICNGLLWILED